MESYIFEGLKVLFYEKSIIKNRGGADITNTFLSEREKLIFGKILDERSRESFWFKYAGQTNADLTPVENIIKVFELQIKEAQYRIYTERKPELSQNLDDFLIYLEKGKLENRTIEEIKKITDSIQKLYDEYGYNKDSATELVGYLKTNLDKLVKK